MSNGKLNKNKKCPKTLSGREYKATDSENCQKA
jgi:hypothetical protein